MIALCNLFWRHGSVCLVLLLSLLVAGMADDSGISNRNNTNSAVLVPPFFVGEIKPITTSNNEAVTSSRGMSESGIYAAQVRLPFTMTSLLSDYVRASKMDRFWKDLLTKDSTVSRVTKVTSPEGGQWQLLAPDAASVNASNFCYLFARDLETHNRLLSMLGHVGMDSILQSLGKELGSSGITIFSMGFVGATHSKAGVGSVLQSHLKASIRSDTANDKIKPMPRAVQLLIPLSLKEGSRPELQVDLAVNQDDNASTTMKLKQKLDVGALFGDTANYGPGQFDYRDSPSDMFLAFAIHFWIHQDPEEEYSEGYSRASSMPLPEFAVEWLQNDNDSSVHHWKRDDPTASLRSLPLIQSEGQVCVTTVSRNITRENGEVCAPENNESMEANEEICIPRRKDVIFWTHPDTYDWSLWTFHHFQEILECHKFIEDYDDEEEEDDTSTPWARSTSEPERRQPPSQEVWMKLRDLYKSMVGSSKSTLSPNEDENSFFVDVIAKPSIPGRGRGIFANQFIPKGTLVYSPRQQARFTDGYLYKKFVMSVSVDLSCDLLMWTSIQKVIVDDVELPPQIIFDLDDGALVNGGKKFVARRYRGSVDMANVGCIPELAKDKPGGCSMNDFALTDIQIGQELLIDYTEFAVFESEAWITYGLH